MPTISSVSYSNGRVTLKWNSDSRAAGYEVSWAEKGALIPWGSPKDAKKNTSMVITNRVIIGATMAFRVRAYWWQGTKIKYTSWSQTKYLKIVDKTSNGNQSCTWGDWSDWTKDHRKVTSNMQEEIRYHWWAAKCKSCGTHNPYWGSDVKCKGCGKKLPAANVTHVNKYTKDKTNMKTISGRANGRKIEGLNYWYCEPQYRYRYKTGK